MLLIYSPINRKKKKNKSLILYLSSLITTKNHYNYIYLSKSILFEPDSIL